MITGNYTITPDAYGRITQEASLILECDTTDAPVIINLPAIAALKKYSGVKIVVFDGTGNASAHNITINSFGSELLGSDGIEVINVNGAGVIVSAVSQTEWLASATAELGTGGSSGGGYNLESGTLTFDTEETHNIVLSGGVIPKKITFYAVSNNTANMYCNSTFLVDENLIVINEYTVIDAVNTFIPHLGSAPGFPLTVLESYTDSFEPCNLIWSAEY